VFVTVVERDARNEAFSKPLIFPGVNGHPKETDKPIAATLRSVHDVVVSDQNSGFAISGPDPSLVFDLPNGTAGSDKTHVKIDLKCQSQSQPVQLQMFWATDMAPGFNEARSIRLTYDPSKPLYPLHLLGSGQAGERLTKLRVDVDSPAVCSKFDLAPPVLVAVSPHSEVCN